MSTPDIIRDEPASQHQVNSRSGITGQGLSRQNPKSSTTVQKGTMAPEQAMQSDNPRTPEENAVTTFEKAPRTRIDGELVPVETEIAPHDATPPKKILRVRPDGTLGSPKAKEASLVAKVKRSMGADKLNPAPKTCIAIVTYGTDNTSRLVIACKIDGIMSGKAATSSLVRAKHTVPAEPPKATHPFFLGRTVPTSGLGSCTAREDLKKAEPDTSPPPNNRKIISPKRSRVTSKPADVIPKSTMGTTLGWNTFGSDHARVTRFPGAKEPIWPPHGVLHVGRGTKSPEDFHSRPGSLDGPVVHRKLKGVEVKVPTEEEVLSPCVDLVHAYNQHGVMAQGGAFGDWRQFRRPHRRLMTGTALQMAVRREIRSDIGGSSLGSAEDHFNDQMNAPPTSKLPTSRALARVYEMIPTTFTAFEKFECEIQEWVHKYAPITSEDVLQPGSEVTILRDWLRGLKINSVDDQSSGSRESSVFGKLGGKSSKRKRKKDEELDGFIVSSDEDTNQRDGITNTEGKIRINQFSQMSVIPTGNLVESSDTLDRSANAIVISGPHGSGKTAAVYAVAQELDFEIFEINAGSRRNGRDILDKVGDMTRNHLVRKEPGEALAMSEGGREQPGPPNERPEREVRTVRQGNVNRFFKSKSEADKSLLETIEKATKKASPRRKEALMRSKCQKTQQQSLILLEEVDVLFEEDKTFWATTLSLIMQSRRPVILTCTDESSLPLDDMNLFAILRFSSPPTELATDYLLLVACNEGHLLSRSAVSALYNAKGWDLRASMMELNFFCQMAIGDTKGGLDWMLKEPAAYRLEDCNSQSIRVVSEGSYQPAMGYLDDETHETHRRLSLNQETELLLEIWNWWGIDIGSLDGYRVAHKLANLTETLKISTLEELQDLDLAAEALSCADTFPASVSREPNMISLETALPRLTDKMRSNYVEGADVLLADPVIDSNSTAESLVIALRACAISLSYHPGHSHKTHPLDENAIACMIPNVVGERLLEERTRKTNAFSAFEALAKSPTAAIGLPKGPQISSFDGPTAVIAEDLAPYVRSIVSYDLKLEQQRRQLSSLLLGPGQEGKKARTTRSSRAALEGGQKAHTRRERWFTNNMNFDLILRSGGSTWQAAVERVMAEASGELIGSNAAGSREFSVGASVESMF